MYVLDLGMGEDFFWHKPISMVERVAENVAAIRAWKNNPRTR